MDWSDLAKKVVGLGAPILGAALGGPFGSAAGAILADALGAEPNPEAVGKAIDDPAAATALQNAQTAWARAAATIAAASARQSVAINETLRAELASGVHWWHWRHLLGYVVILQALLFTLAIARDLWTNDFAGINAGIALASAFTPYFLGFCALLGYVANDTSRLRTAALIGERQQTLIEVATDVTKALLKR